MALDDINADKTVFSQANGMDPIKNEPENKLNNINELATLLDFTPERSVLLLVKFAFQVICWLN